MRGCPFVSNAHNLSYKKQVLCLHHLELKGISTIASLLQPSANATQHPCAAYAGDQHCLGI